MDKTIHLFLFPVAGQDVAATEEMLKEQEIPQNEDETFEDAVVRHFGGEGRWECVTLKGQWTGKQDMEAKAAIRVWRQDIRQFVADELQYPAEVVSRAVETWTFPNCPVTKDGYLALPVGVGEVLYIEVMRRLYPTLSDHPSFRGAK